MKLWSHLAVLSYGAEYYSVQDDSEFCVREISSGAFCYAVEGGSYFLGSG